MTNWNIDAIRSLTRKDIEEATKDWTVEQLREKLIDVIAVSYPIRVTLGAIIDNPNVSHGGMTITSDFFPLTFGNELDTFEEPFGYFYNPDKKKFEPRSFKWDQPKPDSIIQSNGLSFGYSLTEVDFPPGVVPHETFDILNVTQFAIATSIFRGSFNSDDVRAFVVSCKF